MTGKKEKNMHVAELGFPREGKMIIFLQSNAVLYKQLNYFDYIKCIKILSAYPKNLFTN